MELASLPEKEDVLKKKIKTLRDAYRNKVNNIKNCKKSSDGTEYVYKPNLVWWRKIKKRLKLWYG